MDEHADALAPSSPTASAGSRRSSIEGQRDAAALAEEEDVGADDTGMLPYLPPHAQYGDCYEALKQRGKLREMMDLVRPRSQAGLPASLLRCALTPRHLLLTRSCWTTHLTATRSAKVLFGHATPRAPVLPRQLTRAVVLRRRSLHLRVAWAAQDDASQLQGGGAQVRIAAARAAQLPGRALTLMRAAAVRWRRK